MLFNETYFDLYIVLLFFDQVFYRHNRVPRHIWSFILVCESATVDFLFGINREHHFAIVLYQLPIPRSLAQLQIAAVNDKF